LTYLIRFENTGTAEAINIAVSDTLDSFIQSSSLEIVDASHSVDLEMHEDGIANFLFQDINLSFQPGSNTGYVLFTAEAEQQNIDINDRLDNSVAIYFDFNFPIHTNKASIWILDVSSTSSVLQQDNNSIKVYPNPSTSNISIETTNDNLIEKVEWFDMNGKILQTHKMNSKKYDSSITNLAPGIYTLRITTEEFIQVKKVVVQSE